jgi:hypothetical protein
MGGRLSRNAGAHWVLAAGIGVASSIAHLALLVYVSLGDGVAGTELSTVGPTGSVDRALLKADAGWYVRIAQVGYVDPSLGVDEARAWAFYPVLPAAMRLLSATGLPAATGGVAITVLASGAATWAIVRVAEQWSVTRGMRIHSTGAAILWAFSPATTVLALPMTEALFTALAAWTIYCVLTERWLAAALIGSVGALTRPTGIAIAVALVATTVVLYRAGATWRRPAAAAAAILASAAVWPLVVGSRLGDPLRGYVRLQSEEWRSGWDFGIRAALELLAYLRAGGLLGFPYVTLTLVGAIAALIATALLLRARPPTVVGSYTVAVVLLTLGAGAYLTAKLRLLLPAFALWYVPASWLARASRTTAALLLSAWCAIGLLVSHHVLTEWTIAF